MSNTDEEDSARTVELPGDQTTAGTGCINALTCGSDSSERPGTAARAAVTNSAIETRPEWSASKRANAASSDPPPPCAPPSAARTSSST